MTTKITKLVHHSVEAEILRAVGVAAGGSFSMRVESVGSRVTLVVGWIKGLEYRHAEVILAEGGVIHAHAVAHALKEIE